MANAIYSKYKEACMKGSANIDIDGGTVKAARRRNDEEALILMLLEL